ncbi:MAG TPA: cytochrome c [Phycisphaerales bacterium]|nr:cytochrome c [Phycisphaerales bacterium]HMP36018.1 cytochrome c [Phycisphaerales bacterium]
MAHSAPRSPSRSEHEIPRFFVYGGLLVICLLLVPPAIVARVRAAPSQSRKIALIQDMDIQARFGTQQVNPVFVDGRAMRPRVAGTLSRVDPVEPTLRTEGGAEGAWATSLPDEYPLTLELLQRGRDRFAIYCALCHGYAGFGDGIIHVRAAALMDNADGPVWGTSWVQPKSLHDEEIAEQPVGQIFHTVTHGIRSMAGYAAQIPVADRWAIAAYVKALQLSQDASPDDLPPEVRARIVR